MQEANKVDNFPVLACYSLGYLKNAHLQFKKYPIPLGISDLTHGVYSYVFHFHSQTSRRCQSKCSNAVSIWQEPSDTGMSLPLSHSQVCQGQCSSFQVQWVELVILWSPKFELLSETTVSVGFEFQNHSKLASELKTCPFNARHLVPRHELAHHIEHCENKCSFTVEGNY